MSSSKSKIDNPIVEEFITKYSEIREQWRDTHRSHNTGIGKTLEDLLMIDENNLAEADFGEIEIKSQRALTSSKVTLFTKKPSGPDGSNQHIRDNYGITNPKHPDLMQMHASILNKWSKTYEKWGFKLSPDDSEQRLYVDIKNLETDQIEQFRFWYDYDVLREIIQKKMSLLAFVSADSRINSTGTESFKFRDCHLYYGGSFEKFMNLLSEGKIQYDIRIGSYKTIGSKNYGKVHDHGSAFRVAKNDMESLFDGFIKI